MTTALAVVAKNLKNVTVSNEVILSQCPQCNQKLEDSFGIVNCSSCNSVLVADLDGTFKLAESEISSGFNFTQSQPTHGEAQNIVVSEVEQVFQTDVLNESTQEPSNDPIKEIQEFANSEVSSARQGLLKYNLIVDEINSSDLKRLVHDILKDRRLQLPHEQIMNNAKNGQIRIENLNPIKCSMLVSNLRELPLKLQWQQSSILESGGQSNVSNI